MVEVHLLQHRFNRDGAERLAVALQQALATDADLGPRWSQIQSLGLSLQQLSRDLEQEADRVASRLDPTPGVEALSDSLHRLADAFTQLGAIAQAYRSAT